MPNSFPKWLSFKDVLQLGDDLKLSRQHLVQIWMPLTSYDGYWGRMVNSHVSLLFFLSSISSWRLPSPSPASLHWLLQQRRQPRTITKTMLTPASLCQDFCEINAYFRNSNPWCPLFLALLLPFPGLALSWLWSLKTMCPALKRTATD